MAEQEGMDAREAQRRLIRRTMEDESFRQEFLRDPRSALEGELGRSLPENVEVRAVEDTHDTVHFVLPPRSIAERSGELSEEDLDAVAGGTISVAPTAIASCGC